MKDRIYEIIETEKQRIRNQFKKFASSLYLKARLMQKPALS